MCLAVPGEILSIDGSGPLLQARVSFAGNIKDICLAYTPEARPGDFVLVHAGFSLSVLKASRAEDILSQLEGLTERSGS